MKTDANIQASVLLTNSIAARLKDPKSAANAAAAAATNAAVAKPAPQATTVAATRAQRSITKRRRMESRNITKRRRLRRIVKKLRAKSLKVRFRNLNKIAPEFKKSRKLNHQISKTEKKPMSSMKSLSKKIRAKNTRDLQTRSKSAKRETASAKVNKNGKDKLKKDAEGPNDLYSGNYDQKKADEDLKAIVEVWKLAQKGLDTAKLMKAQIKVDIVAVSKGAAVYLSAIAGMLNSKVSNISSKTAAIPARPAARG